MVSARKREREHALLLLRVMWKGRGGVGEEIELFTSGWTGLRLRSRGRWTRRKKEEGGGGLKRRQRPENGLIAFQEQKIKNSMS